MITQEEKELLLKDLCMRLPYSVKVWYKYYSDNVTSKFATSIRLVDGKIALSSKFNREGDWYPIEEANEFLIKPYLRPMSSMTEEESNELESITFPLMEKDWNGNENPACIRWIDIPKYMDFILSHQFDYQGLIEKNLAIEVTENNNPYEN